MISNFLMCLGYVPNEEKEVVNFMILECVMVHFFSECLALERGIFQPVCYKHGLFVWEDLLPLDGLYIFQLLRSLRYVHWIILSRPLSIHPLRPELIY